MNPHRQNARSRPAQQAGYSLLEVLLASALATVILAALWSTLSLHLRLFDAGLAEVEQAQLARALLSRIASDLEQAIPPTVAGGAATAVADSAIESSSSGTSSSTSSLDADSTSGGHDGPIPSSADTPAVPISHEGRRAGFIGTPQRLQIDVVRTASESVDEENLESQTPLERAHSVLQTIVYEIVELPVDALYAHEDMSRRNTEPDAATDRFGLVRRRLGWSDAALGPSEETRGRSPEARIGSAEITTGPRHSIHSPKRATGTLDETEVSKNNMFVPEVAELAFRYYDGSEWSDFWDSRAQRSLPAAVEITLRFHTPGQSEHGTSATGDHEAVSDEGERFGFHDDGQQPSVTHDEQYGPGRYRLVVRLPAAGRRRESGYRQFGMLDGDSGTSLPHRAALQP